MMQTREGDRYSQRLRLLDDAYIRSGLDCESSSGLLLAVRRVHPEVSGGQMPESSSLHHRELRMERRAVESVHEIARLRARRAARLSVEAAAGRRRLLLSATCALATAVVGLIAALTSLSWFWIVIPGVFLASALTASRLAAVRSHRADQAELELLAQLRDYATKAPTRHFRSVEQDSFASYEGNASTALPGSEDVSEVDSLVLDNEQVKNEEGTRVVCADQSTCPDEVTGADENTCADEAEDPLPDSASVERRTWSVGSVPAPTYAMRGRVTGRVVHSDTDLRGIPRVDALVPARPLVASEMKSARSTAQVASEAECAFDLDAVLEARRAQ